MSKSIARQSFMSALAIAATAVTAEVRAADEVGKFYINPFYGYTWLDESRGVDDGDHFGSGFGFHLTEHLSVEINGLMGEFEGGGGRELDQQAFSLDYLGVFARSSAVSPYLTFGGGYIENKYSTDIDEYGPFAQAGAGLLIDLGENRSRTFVFQLRPEVKYRFDWADGPVQDDHGDLIINLGFAFNFGAPDDPPAPVMPPPPPPAPPPPAPPPPTDSDGDGVLDDADRCPGTARGVVVDSNGCPRPERVVLRGVEFATNSATLTAGSRPVLDGVAEDLRKTPRLRVELQGHTDSRGADAYNLDLSQRRADSVRDYLIAMGVNPTQLVARGYGETEPIADNATDLGRAENRRVTMRVLENPANVEVEGGAGG